MDDDFDIGPREFNISGFTRRALETFRYQYRENPIYRSYADLLRVSPGSVESLQDIPFLPIGFFKTHRVVSGNFSDEAVFESSGTTRTGNSRHHVRSLAMYRESFLAAFRMFYGDPREWCILSLLPSYLERGNSSLIVMADELMRISGHPENGFYLDQYARLHDTLLQLERAGQRTMLLGVTFALLDFSEAFPMELRHTVVMETGGMKGRKREMTRDEVHERLKKGLGIPAVHSEYGMTELLSQAYSKGDGLFGTPPWMHVFLRAEDDPLCLADDSGRPLQTGLINIIDLANRHSCAFIATDDLGRLSPDGTFEVLGRVDNSDVRGCSLMVV
jgi:hypothetical protein